MRFGISTICIRLWFVGVGIVSIGANCALAQPTSEPPETCEGDLTKIDGKAFYYPDRKVGSNYIYEKNVVFKFEGTPPCVDEPCQIRLIELQGANELASLEITPELYSSFKELCKKSETRYDYNSERAKQCRGRIDYDSIEVNFESFYARFHQISFNKRNNVRRLYECGEAAHADIAGRVYVARDLLTKKGQIVEIISDSSAKLKEQPKWKIDVRHIVPTQ